MAVDGEQVVTVGLTRCVGNVFGDRTGLGDREQNVVLRDGAATSNSDGLVGEVRYEIVRCCVQILCVCYR